MLSLFSRLFGAPKPAPVPKACDCGGCALQCVRSAGEAVSSLGAIGWQPNRSRHDSGYHKPASAYLAPEHAASQVVVVLRALCSGKQLTSLDVEKLLREAGNPIIDGGRALRHCKAICEASGCVLQEKTITVGSGKRVKLRWLNLTDRQKLRGA